VHVENDKRWFTSMSLSVKAVHCLSCSFGIWNVDDRHKPPNPIPSRTSSNISAVSTPPENFGFDVIVLISVWADSRVTAF